MSLLEILHEVVQRRQSARLRYLFHGHKRRRQHRLRCAKAQLAQKLPRTRARFLFEKMAKSRRREVHQHGERASVPRA